MANSYYDNASEEQRLQPGTTARAEEVDGKFDQVASGFDKAADDFLRSLKLPVGTSTDQVITANALNRRNLTIGFDADGNLTLRAGLKWEGDWTADTDFISGDMVRAPNDSLYICSVSHTSGSTFSDTNWSLALDVYELNQIKDQAADARDAAQLAESGAQTAESNAVSAKNSAQTAESGAQTAESGAQTAETNAVSAKDAAQLSESGAQTAESGAQSAESGAQSAETAAVAARDDAQLAETGAQNAESAAVSARDAAQTAESGAQSAETGAVSAKNDAEAALDSLNDLYLGVKSTEPATDNDGNPLQIGALYYNDSTTPAALRLWNGTSWVDAAFDTNGALVASNNLSDLTDVAAARANLAFANVASSGSYNDLTDTPTLGTAAEKSDTRYAHRGNNLSDLASATMARGNLGLATLAATGAWADILNKPAFAPVATSGSFADLSGSASPSRYDLSAAAVTATLDLAIRQVFRVDATANRTLSFANEPSAGRGQVVIVNLIGSGGTVTWPSGINWDDNTAPEIRGSWTGVALQWDGDSWRGSVWGGSD